MKPIMLPALCALALASSTMACGKKDTPTAAGSDAASAPASDPAKGPEEAAPRREPEPDKGEPQAERPSPDQPPAQPAGAVAPPPGASPLSAPALAAVPKGAPFVVVGSPKKLLDALGYEGLIEAYGAMLGEVGAQMSEVTGKDLFKLASWAEIGVDLQAPAGVFMPDLRTEAVVTFLGLSDGDKLVAFVSEAAKKAEAPLSTEKVGDATLITLGERDRQAWLVHGTTFYSVSVMRGNGAAALAKEILSRKADDAITTLPEFAQAVADLHADELGAFVQLRMILDQFVMGELDAPKMSTDHLERQLEEARKNDDKAEVARLEAAIADEKAWAERWEKRRQAEAELVKSIVGELSTLAVGVDISDTAAEAQIKLALAEGGALRGLLKNASEAQPILKASASEPLFLLSGQVDPKAYWSLIEKAMAAEGEDVAELRGALRERLGVDLDKDVIGALTGELAFALTGDMATLLKAEDPRAELGGTLLVGLSDSAGLKALLSKLAAQEGADRFAKWDEATSTLNITVPGQRAIAVTFQGDRLVASTETDIAARLGGGESFVAKVENAALKALYERKDLAALFSMPQEFMGAWFIAMRSFDGYSPPLPKDATPEAKAKHEELTKLDAEIRPLRQKVEEARMKPIMDMFHKLGTLAEAVTMDGQGARATLGIYTRGATIPEVVRGFVDLAVKGEAGDADDPDEKRLRELEDKRWKLESELWDLNRPKAEEAVPEPQ